MAGRTRAGTTGTGGTDARPMAPSPRKPSLLRNLGAFFGHIAHGVRTPVGRPAAPTPAPTPPPPPALGAQVVRREVAERTVSTPRGEFVLRRTVIDEVRPAPPGDGAAPGSSSPPGGG